MELFDSLKQKINGQNKTIVFPEGEDARVLGAASRLAADGLIKSVVLGKQSDVEATAKDNNIDLSHVTLLDPATIPADQHKEMLDALVARRKGKNTPEQAAEMLKDPNYIGTMMVYMGQADGMVSGAVHATGDTVRPALQIIKLRKASTVSVGPSSCKKVTNATSSRLCHQHRIDAAGMAEVAVESATPLRSLTSTLRLPY